MEKKKKIKENIDSFELRKSKIVNLEKLIKQS